MTLNPFVFGSARNPECFDERSPCKLEQTSMCVIKIAQDAAKAKGDNTPFAGQSEYVPWLVCMDSNGDPTTQCDSQVGVSTSAVNQCLDSGESKTLLAEYLKTDASINSTPTVEINGKKVKNPTYRAVRTALCKADPSLSGCSAPWPNDADVEVPISYKPTPNHDYFDELRRDIVV